MSRATCTQLNRGLRVSGSHDRGVFHAADHASQSTLAFARRLEMTDFCGDGARSDRRFQAEERCAEA